MSAKSVCGIVLVLLLAVTLMSMFNIISVKSQWTGTVYILANGDVSPPDAPIETSDKITYTLTEDITSNGVGIEVRRSNIIINGNGYILQGAGIGDGFYLYDVSNVTVTNVNIKNFYYGIYLPPSSNNTKIFGNNITENIDSGIYDSSSNNCIRWNNIIRNKGTGISTCDSSKNEIYENNITDNNFYGIYLYSSLSSDIYGNNITNNDDGGIVLDHFSNNNSITNNAIIENSYYGIALSYSSNNNSISDNTFVNCGLLVSDSYQNIIENNTVNDKPLIYLEGVSNYIVSDAGQVILVRCDNILVEGLNLSRTTVGIELWETSNSTISENTITENNGDGVWLCLSSNNSIIGNTIKNNWHGILLTSSFNNSIIGNNITNNTCGIKLEGGSGNSLVGNTITNNSQGIYIIIDFPNPNKIYHNNFKDNDQHVLINGANAWDNDYPSGGNYWSNYTGVDEKSGPYQNETGSDGIGDTPYTIDEYNVDKYPLMAPLSTFEAGVWNGTDLKINVITNSTVSNLEIDRDHKKVSLNVSGTSGFAGYCRITIPNIIVQELWQSSYSVLLNGDPWPFENWTDTANTYIYINYVHSEHQITIIPEFPSAIALSLLMLTTLIAMVFSTKNRKTQLPCFPLQRSSL